MNKVMGISKEEAVLNKAAATKTAEDFDRLTNLEKVGFLNLVAEGERLGYFRTNGFGQRVSIFPAAAVAAAYDWLENHGDDVITRTAFGGMIVK